MSEGCEAKPSEDLKDKKEELTALVFELPVEKMDALKEEDFYRRYEAKLSEDLK